jgi:O-methyltransferase involved in polyketide biosynthesis
LVADRKRQALTENPVSLTAYWTMGVRYEDAAGDSPVAGDTFAHRFMDDRAREVADQFRSLAKPNATVPVRHRLIDDRLAAELERDPALRVVVLGCGFDSRPFRLGGGRWVEVDEPALLAHKESLLPASEAANELERVPIRFGVESLEERLRPFAGEERVVVVLEGILNYLGDAERQDLLSTLTRLFPHHAVLCDMLGRRFIALYSRGLVKHLRALGIEFSSSSETPEALFHAFGYRTASRTSVWTSANELGVRGAPPPWAVRILPSLRDGYCLWSFEYARDVS